MTPHTPHGPVDTVLAKLHSACAAPHRFDFIFNETFPLISLIADGRQREFLKDKLEEIGKNRFAPRELIRISAEIEQWSDAMFPLRGKPR